MNDAQLSDGLFGQQTKEEKGPRLDHMGDKLVPVKWDKCFCNNKKK